VREVTVPAIIPVASTDTVGDAVFDNARDRPDLVSFSRPAGDGSWVDVTAAQFAAEVRGVARGLIEAGVRLGDRVGLMSRNRYEWALLDYAIWAAGAVSVPIYETSSAEQVQWILSDSGAVAVVVETGAHATLVESVKPDVPAVRHVWTIDSDAVGLLTEAGGAVTADELEARRTAVRADDLATIIYTSGTTGRPKGCELTHRNLLFDVMTSNEGLGTLFNADGSTLLFLPLAHVFGRVIEIGAVLNRARLGHCPDVKQLLPDLATFQPTFVLSVPRVFE
jgi:long-chain acyl-CoA synthetase